MVEFTEKEKRENQRIDDLFEVDGIIEEHYDKDDDAYCRKREMDKKTPVSYFHLNHFNVRSLT